MAEGFQGGESFDHFTSDIKEGPGRVRSIEETWGGECKVNFKEYPPKGDHLNFIIYVGSIHDTKVYLQYNMGKPSTGAIWIYVKVWDLFKDTINRVKASFF